VYSKAESIFIERMTEFYKLQLDSATWCNTTATRNDKSTYTMNGYSMIERMTDMMEEISAANEPPIIPVWVGDRVSVMGMNLNPLPSEYPRFIESNLMDPDEMSFYIVAGLGIVGNKKTMDYFWQEGYLAVWTDEVPERKVQ